MCTLYTVLGTLQNLKKWKIQRMAVFRFAYCFGNWIESVHPFKWELNQIPPSSQHISILLLFVSTTTLWGTLSWEIVTSPWLFSGFNSWVGIWSLVPQDPVWHMSHSTAQTPFWEYWLAYHRKPRLNAAHAILEPRAVRDKGSKHPHWPSSKGPFLNYTFSSLCLTTFRGDSHKGVASLNNIFMRDIYIFSTQQLAPSYM